jgi:ATP-dependent helicase HrpA
VWIESAAQHLLKREFLEPDWDDDREEVVARERLSFLGLILSAGRKVNYGPIAPEESRRIFAREALVHQRLARRPDWLRANDEAVLAAQRMEDRLRVRDLLRASESFVDFYDRVLPRQVSSAATLDYFTRNLSETQRADLELQPDDIFAREPDRELLAQFPEAVNLPAGPEGHPGAPDGALPPLRVPIEYRFAPGDERDGATLELPLLALPNLTRAAVDAALPGLAAPRIEALLRSLPKDARRTLIPIGAAVEAFMRSAGPCTEVRRLAEWLQESRGLPASLIHFDMSTVPAHLTPQIAVLRADSEAARDPEPAALRHAKQPDRAPLRVLACGRDLRHLRRRCAAAARAELDRLARQAYPSPWTRFDADLPEYAQIDVGQGCVPVCPALAASSQGVEVRFEWSREEAERRFRRGASSLARLMLERQAKDLARRVAADTPLMLAAGPYLSNSLSDALLHLTFSRACFEDLAPPRSRSEFDAAVDRGRERLHPALEEVAAAARTWFTEARGVRRLLDDPRARSAQELATESHEHLRQLLDIDRICYISVDYIRYIPKYIKAEERRWQRLLARGGEPPAIGRELLEWRERARTLRAQAQAEMRSPPQLDDLDVWIEEYRVSLYAQELRTQGPVSAARLGARAAQIEAWLTR